MLGSLMSNKNYVFQIARFLLDSPVTEGFIMSLRQPLSSVKNNVQKVESWRILTAGPSND